MISLNYTFLVWTYGVMVSDGLSDVITPCGLRLCRELCETRSTCSLLDYSVETLTCVLRNRELYTGQVGERMCRTLTSIHGQELALCYKGQKGAPEISTAATKVNKVKKPEGDTPIDVSKLKAGTPVVLSNDLYGIFMGQQGAHEISTAATKVNKVKKPEGDIRIDVRKLKAGTPVVLSNDLYGIFMGKENVLFSDQQVLQYKDLGDISIRSVMTYEYGKAKRDPPATYTTAIGIQLATQFGRWENYTNKGLVFYCLTRKP